MQQNLRKLIVIIPLLLISCASLEQDAYVTIGSVGSTANAAIGAYMDYINTHPVSQDELIKVRNTINLYITSMETARSISSAYKLGTASAKDLQRAVDKLTVSNAALLNTVKIP